MCARACICGRVCVCVFCKQNISSRRDPVCVHARVRVHVHVRAREGHLEKEAHFLAFRLPPAPFLPFLPCPCVCSVHICDMHAC